jgi:hypothetical protein
MRITVVGASGNVGTSLVEVLAGEPAVDSIVQAGRPASRRRHLRR